VALLSRPSIRAQRHAARTKHRQPRLTKDWPSFRLLLTTSNSVASSHVPSIVSVHAFGSGAGFFIASALARSIPAKTTTGLELATSTALDHYQHTVNDVLAVDIANSSHLRAACASAPLAILIHRVPQFAKPRPTLGAATSEYRGYGYASPMRLERFQLGGGSRYGIASQNPPRKAEGIDGQRCHCY
jgi:hypothetical protein